MIGLGGGLGAGCRARRPAAASTPATPYVLSSATDAANGPTAATGGVDTDGADGTLYVVALLTGDSTPSAEQIEAGAKADDSPAEWAHSQGVAGAGTQTVAYAGTMMLAPETGYKLAFMHKSAAGARSNVVVADGFTTPAVLTGTIEGGGTSTANPTTATGSVAVAVGDAIVVRITEQTNTGTATAVTDNLGNTYEPEHDWTNNSTTSGRTFSSIATVAGTLTTINVAATASSNDIAVKAAVFAGPFSAVDASPAEVTDFGSPHVGPSTGLLAQESEVVVATLSGTSTGVSHSVNAPLANAGSVASGGLRRAAIGYLNTEAVTGINTGWTLGANDNIVLGAISFRRAA